MITIKKWSVLLSVAFFTASILIGCGGEKSTGSSDGSNDENSTTDPKDNFVTIATGASGGTYYLLGSGIVSMLNNHEPDITANSEATNGTADNINLLKNGDVNFGVILADVAYKAYASEGDYSSANQDNLRIVMKGHNNDLQVVTLENSGINSLSDLKGKRVSLAYGLPDVTADILNAASGLEQDKDYQSEILPHDDAVTALKDGNIDAITFLTAAPASAITDIASTHDVRIIPLSDEERSNVIEKYSYFEERTLEEGIYKGVDEDVDTLMISVFLLTNEEVSEDLVYKITKSILDNPEEFSTIHQSAESWTLPGAAEGFHIPAHPGAIKYYEEKGIEVE